MEVKLYKFLISATGDYRSGFLFSQKSALVTHFIGARIGSSACSDNADD
jgi:hypothetical protein